MWRHFIALTFALFSTAAQASAEPITLKLAFFSSDRSHLYLSGVKPFIDAINLEGAGRVRVVPYLSAQLGGLDRLSQLIREGAVDIGYVIPPYERAVFPDTSVIELPGFFKNAAEATHVFSQLLENDLLGGFNDFFVIGAFASEPESIHLRQPISTLADLKGKTIRSNNPIETEVLEKLGAKSAIVPINQTAQAISAGDIDGAYVPPVPMIEFGIGRVAPVHYFLRTSCVPQMLLMSRKKFDGLPADVRDLISKRSGAWFIENYNRVNTAATEQVMKQLAADQRRKVVFPSESDMRIADAVFKKVVDGYANQSAHNAKLVETVRAAVAKRRAAER